MPINRGLVPFLREAKPENFAYLQRWEGSFFYSEGRMGWGVYSEVTVFANRPVAFAVIEFPL